ncbi:MAG: hypothetical protein ACOY3I_02020 [Verrucomicrobiota bacterium]
MIGIVVTLIAGLSVASAHAESVQAVVLNVTGKVTVTAKNGAQAAQLNKNDKVNIGSQIETGINGVVALSLVPGGNVMAQPGSSFKISTLEVERSGETIGKCNVDMSLSKGAIVVDFAPGDKKSEMTIKTTHGTYVTKDSTAQVIIGSIIVNLLRGTGEVITPDNNVTPLETNQSFTSNTDGTGTHSSLGSLGADQLASIMNFMTNAMGGAVGLLGGGAFGADMGGGGGLNNALPSFGVSGNRIGSGGPPVASPSAP